MESSTIKIGNTIPPLSSLTRPRACFNDAMGDGSVDFQDLRANSIDDLVIGG